MKRILLTVMVVLSFFLMCGGCASENHGLGGEGWDRNPAHGAVGLGHGQELAATGAIA
jgi:hypothetical protein